MSSARSWLFVPADSEKKLGKAPASGADALILDLEDSVAAPRKAAGRELAADWRASPARRTCPAEVWVRVNPTDTEWYADDIRSLAGEPPAGIIVPKVSGPDELSQVARDLSELERRHDLPGGSIAVVPIVTETPAGVLALPSYGALPDRVAGLTWGAEDLSAAIGAVANTNDDGSLAFTYRLARSLALLAASAGAVAAIETVYTDFRDAAGLARTARAAARDGFTGMLAIHPAQVEPINAAFTPSDEDVAHARAVLAAFEDSAATGVASLDGQMLDRPHRLRAQRIVDRVALNSPRRR